MTNFLYSIFLDKLIERIGILPTEVKSIYCGNIDEININEITSKKNFSYLFTKDIESVDLFFYPLLHLYRNNFKNKLLELSNKVKNSYILLNTFGVYTLGDMEIDCIDMREIADYMQSIGYKDVVVDSNVINICYDSLKDMISDFSCYYHLSVDDISNYLSKDIIPVDIVTIYANGVMPIKSSNTTKYVSVSSITYPD